MHFKRLISIPGIIALEEHEAAASQVWQLWHLSNSSLEGSTVFTSPNSISTGTINVLTPPLPA